MCCTDLIFVPHRLLVRPGSDHAGQAQLHRAVAAGVPFASWRRSSVREKDVCAANRTVLPSCSRPRKDIPFGKHINGNLGRTLVPTQSASMSTNGNIQIIINSKGTLNHRTVGIAHELGHVIKYIRGEPHKHGEKDVDEFINQRSTAMSKRLGYDY